MTIRVNGETQEVETGTTVRQLLVVNDVAQPDMVSVQLNGEFVDRNRFPDTLLKEGDEIDFLYFMGGGAL
ncbi:MAG: sulfur carrier protein ThiS [Acidobacteria bacterium]|nr:MAG: sulfur carrier protein ThiS [Acidobacteriota bacterium]